MRSTILTLALVAAFGCSGKDEGEVITIRIESEMHESVERSGKENRTKSTLNLLKQYVTQYRIKTNEMPGSLDVLRDEQIVEEVPRDAWGNDIAYKLKGNSIELRSAGDDGQMGTADDIVVTGP